MIFGFRNACLELFQAEIDHFRKILLFLYKIYSTIVSLQDTDPAFPDFRIPIYHLDEEPLLDAKSFMKNYDLECPVDFNESMTCGETAEEQKIFLKIPTDDDEFCFNSLQSVRFFLDKCGRFFGTTLATNSETKPVMSGNNCDRQLSQTRQPNLDAPQLRDWMDIFEEHDMQDLLATVRADILQRQELKKVVGFEAPRPTPDPVKVQDIPDNLTLI